MPGMNGLELHQQLMASNHPIPATLMTECAEELVREQAL
jgi:CheY-like chemotaxis protein